MTREELLALVNKELGSTKLIIQSNFLCCRRPDASARMADDHRLETGSIF